MILRRILAAVCLLCALCAALPAHAQKTKAAINTEIGLQFPDNVVGAILPLNLRNITLDLANSIMPTAPVVTGNLACFDGTTGLLKDCGSAPATVPLTIGTTPVGGGTTTRILFDNAGVLGEYTISGSGAVCMNVSCSMTTPALGVATGTSLALGGAAIGGNALAVTGTSLFNSGTTFGAAITYGGVTLSNAVTGTGNMVLSSGPAFTGPISIAGASAVALAVGLNGVTNPAFNVDASTASQAAGLNVKGAATGGTVAVSTIDSGGATNLTIDAKGTGTIGIGNTSTGAIKVAQVTVTRPATGSTLTIADGKTLTANNTLTFTGTDGSSVALGTGGTVTYTIASGATALGTGAISSATCAAAVTATATGAATTDVLTASFNSDPTAVTGYVPLTTGMLTIIAYPTTNTANFKVCNNTGSSITPGAITLNWRVVR